MHANSSPVKARWVTPGVLVLWGLMAAGLAAALYRLAFGLGASTNLSDSFPWGIWIAIDVTTGVALAAGGFTTAALVHIFHKERYEAVTRPALLTAVLGYTFVVLGLMLDLGRYYNIWHPMLPWMWQGNSVLFEVAMCVMAYLTVLYLEFMPIVCERFRDGVRLPGPLAAYNGLADRLVGLADRWLGRTMTLLILLGVVLSCMHQSSLGGLMLIAPYKMNPLWYTPILPMLFLMSAISVGFPMVVVESMWSSWSFGRKPETEVLGPLTRYTVVLLGAYGVAKIADLLIRGAYVGLAQLDTASVMFVIEMLAGVILPVLLLSNGRIRRNPKGLLVACALIVGGVALNRINVFLVAFHPPFTKSVYFPSLSEILVTTGLVAGLVFVYRTIVMLLPVLPGGETPVNSSRPVAVKTVRKRAPEASGKTAPKKA